MRMRAPATPIIAMTFLLLLSLFLYGCNRSTVGMSIGDRFMVSDDDVITDLITGMQWKVGSDCDIDWEDAREWIESLGCDWEMPTFSQLNELWNAGISVTTWGPFTNSGRYVWCLYFDGDGKSHEFSFIPIDPFAMNCGAIGTRVFAIRVSRQNHIVARRTFRSSNLFGFLLSRLY